MYPGQEKIIREHYQKNPTELVKLRGPLFEDKVIDLIQKKAKIKVKSITKDDLQKLISFTDQKASKTKTNVSSKPKAKKSRKK